MVSPRERIERTLSQFQYLPAAAPQRVTLTVAYPSEVLVRGVGAMLSLMLRILDHGLGASDVFPPHLGSARLVRSPSEPYARELSFDVEVARIATVSWLGIACFLTTGFADRNNRLVASSSATLVGEASGPETQGLSAILAALDPSAVRRFEPLPFTFERDDDERRAELRIESCDPLDEAAVSQLLAHVGSALRFLNPYAPPFRGPTLSSIGQQQAIGNVADSPRGAREIAVPIERFDMPAALIMAAVSNALYCFHHRVAPLAHVGLKG